MGGAENPNSYKNTNSPGGSKSSLELGEKKQEVKKSAVHSACD